MTSRQIEELAKLFLDLGKLTFASLVLGFFQSNLQPITKISYEFIGLIIFSSFCIMGIQLLKEVKNG